VLLSLALASSATRGQTSAKFQVAPAPEWVLRHPEVPAPAAWEGRITPWVQLLDDEQTRVLPGGEQRYSRVVEQALSEKGIEHISKAYFCFDPTVQKLVIHHVRLVRGKEVTDVLRPDRINQSEDEERSCLETKLTDVRKGDILDYAYSLTGTSPQQVGRFAETVRLGRDTSTDHLRRRILWPAQQKLYLRTRNTAVTPSVRRVGREIEYLWEPELLSETAYYRGAPPWFDQAPQVQVSDFASWQQVAQFAAPWYRVPDPLPERVAKQVDEWRSQFPDQATQLLTAVRFVQDEIRRGSDLIPRPIAPEMMLTKRQGSSYDAALLLCTLLRGLKIEAAPALVNTRARHTLEEYQPSLAAFDRAVVRVALAGRVYWFDPQKMRQRGGLDQHANPAYARALVLLPGTQRLTEIPPPPIDASSVVVKEIYQASSYREPVKFEVLTAYRGIAADAMRQRLFWQTLSEYAKFRKEHYAGTTLKVTTDGEARVSDNTNKNELVLTERYTIQRLWRGKHVGFQAEQIATKLQETGSTGPVPLEIEYPMDFRQIIEIHSPTPLSVARSEVSLADDALRLSYRISAEQNVVTLDYRLQSLRSFVPADKVHKHRQFREQLRQKLSYDLSHPGDPLMLSYAVEYWPFVLMAVLLIIGLALLLW
jgi:hypothetical protein